MPDPLVGADDSVRVELFEVGFDFRRVASHVLGDQGQRHVGVIKT